MFHIAYISIICYSQASQDSIISIELTADPTVYQTNITNKIIWGQTIIYAACPQLIYKKIIRKLGFSSIHLSELKYTIAGLFTHLDDLILEYDYWGYYKLDQNLLAAEPLCLGYISPKREDYQVSFESREPPHPIFTKRNDTMISSISSVKFKKYYDIAKSYISKTKQKLSPYCALGKWLLKLYDKELTLDCPTYLRQIEEVVDIVVQ